VSWPNNNNQIPSTGDNSHGSGEWLTYTQLKQEIQSSHPGHLPPRFEGPGANADIFDKIRNHIKSNTGYYPPAGGAIPGWAFQSTNTSATILKFIFCQASNSNAAQNASTFYEFNYYKSSQSVSPITTVVIPGSQNNNSTPPQQSSGVPSQQSSGIASQQPSGNQITNTSSSTAEPEPVQTTTPLTWDDNNLDLASQTLPSLTGKRANLGIGTNDFGISLEASRKVTRARLDLQRSTSDTNVSNANPLNKNGIYSNRPSILLDSTYVNIDPEDTRSRESIRFDSSVLYNLVKKNFLKENLNFLKDESYEDYIEFEELYKEFQFKIEEVISLIDEIDELKENFINSLDDYSETGLNSLGYEDNKTNPTKAFLQLTYEIGGYPFHINPYFMNLAKGLQPSEDRNLGSETTRSSETYSVVNISNQYSLPKFKSHLNRTRGNEQGLSNPGYRLKGNNDGFWFETEKNPNNIPYQSGYQSVSDVLILMNDKPELKISSAIENTQDGNVGNISGVAIANFIWSELYNSYVYYNATPTKKIDLDKERINKNVLYNIIGEDTLGNNLVSADNSSGIAKILRYPSANITIMPFELPGLAFESEDASLANVKTGLEQWIDPNIGNMFEGEETNYASLDSWLDELDSFINSVNKKIDPFANKGGAMIIYNEIIRSFEYIANGNVSFIIRQPVDMGTWGILAGDSMMSYLSPVPKNFDDFEAFHHDISTFIDLAYWLDVSE